MEQNVGIWVDHRRAVLVSFVAGGEEMVQSVESDMDKQPPHETGGSKGHPGGQQSIVSEENRERHFEQHMKTYYREIEARLNNAAGIYIFGPGEARKELKKHLERNHSLADKIQKVEPADKMLDKEIVRQARNYFHPGKANAVNRP
ncbi:hypothetical protein QQM79_06125 [Marinobacteraceae bacterium S3BR75-40.1]